ncbi:MAG: right-handed parallel beta-helix repeat-containing protein [Kiritimatiellae bacterium]|nr:right-handed parallel beta-helix repeat-containing protein [Kiritimatiellia bacterium]
MRQSAWVVAIPSAWVFAAVALHACVAGPLDPPGPPGSDAAAMKTLNQVEPRNYISALPYQITNAGSYYLTGDLLGRSNENGVIISCDGVELDLNGFTLIGVTGALNGVVFAQGTTEVYKYSTIRNGGVCDWPQCGIAGEDAHDGKLIDLRVYNNGYPDGYAGVSVWENWTVSGCQSFYNAGVGLKTEALATVRDSSFRGNGASGLIVGWGSTVERCQSFWNGTNGITTRYGYCTVRDCTSIRNTSNGVYAAQNSLIQNNLCGENTACGIEAESGCRIECNHATGNMKGIRVDPSAVECLVIWNSVRSNLPQAQDYDLPEAGHYGMILSNASLGAAFWDSNPSANFQLTTP